MKKLSIKLFLLSLLVLTSLLFTPVLAVAADADQSVYITRFLEMWEDLHDPANGYFSPDGAPYHSIETLLVEAPDHGHETTSEAYSYWIWLEAMYGRITGDWSYLQTAWETMEAHIIPTHDLQPTNASYNPASPATYAGEHALPDNYPSLLEFEVPVGSDPIANELASTYGTDDIYGMHWLLDCDNFYGYGNKGDGVSTPSYINTFQRGEQESCYETVPQPSWEDFSWGGPNGYLDLFTDDAAYAKQWRYTIASDADARAVQAVYWAYLWAKEQGLDPNQAVPVAKASKMGDYLRYSMFDKYFKKIGAEDKNSAGGSGFESSHYLLSWYYAWGGSADPASSWAWRIGSSHNHFGYQNPMAAWVLSSQDDFIPASPSAQGQWEKSYKRQVEFYRYLQSDEGAIAGGATNSWGGQYQPYPAGQSTFYGMAYTENPVYHDPGSNTWFGMQAWSMERMCELYYLTEDDPMVDEVVEKWAGWAKSVIRLLDDGTYEIPGKIDWTGQPDTWNPANPGANADLHVSVETYGQDVGIAGCLAKALAFYAAGTRNRGNLDTEARDLAKELLDRMWDNYRDDKGIAVLEKRGDFSRIFEQEVYVPAGFKGEMPNGDVIEPGIKFIDIRSGYKNDPRYNDLVEAYENGTEFEETYHRFWGQADIMLAMADFGYLFDDVVQEYSPSVTISTSAAGEPVLKGTDVEITISATDPDGTVSKVDLYNGTTLVESFTAAPYTYTFSTTVKGTFTFNAVATDNDDNTGSKSVTIEVVDEIVPKGDVAVEYAAGNSTSSTHQITGKLNLVNKGNEAVSINELKIRYYYSLEKSVGQNFNCYHAAMGSGNVSAAFGTDGGEHYVEISLSGSGSIAAGSQSGEIQFAINNNDWSQYNQANDHSFDGDASSFVENENIVLYLDGKIVWGKGPNGTTPTDEDPVVSIISPASGETFNEGDSVTITAGATDDKGVSKVDFYLGTILLGSDTAAPYSQTTSALTEGTYTIIVTATDTAGNVDSETVIIKVVDPTIDLDPVVTITSPADASEFITGENITIAATASDDNEVVKVDFYNGTILLASDTSAPYSYTIVNAAKGTYTLQAVATDNAGNTGSDSITVTVKDDVQPEGDLVLQYAAGNSANATQHITGKLNIINSGTSSVDLSDLKIRYYYTPEKNVGQNFNCYYAAIGGGNVSGSFGGQGSQHYLEISLSGSGSIAAGGQTGEIHFAVNNNDWSQFNQANDYSFNGDASSLMNWDKAVILLNGTVVWGVAP